MERGHHFNFEPPKQKNGEVFMPHYWGLKAQIDSIHQKYNPELEYVKNKWSRSRKQRQRHVRNLNYMAIVRKVWEEGSEVLDPVAKRILSINRAVKKAEERGDATHPFLTTLDTMAVSILLAHKGKSRIYMPRTRVAYYAESEDETFHTNSLNRVQISLKYHASQFVYVPAIIETTLPRLAPHVRNAFRLPDGEPVSAGMVGELLFDHAKFLPESPAEAVDRHIRETEQARQKYGTSQSRFRR